MYGIVFLEMYLYMKAWSGGRRPLLDLYGLDGLVPRGPVETTSCISLLELEGEIARGWVNRTHPWCSLRSRELENAIHHPSVLVLSGLDHFIT